MANKSLLVKAAAAPKDAKTSKVLDIRDWTLRPYIEVGHELGWITRSAKDVAGVLSEYRNYVHPEKERRHNVELQGQDTAMLWGVTKSLVQQLLDSAPIRTTTSRAAVADRAQTMNRADYTTVPPTGRPDRALS